LSTNTHGGGVLPLTKIKDFSDLLGFYRALSTKNSKKFPDQRLKPAMANGTQLTLKAAFSEGA
jgi:hypothetical protein